MSTNRIDAIKKAHEARRIKQKDYSFKNLFENKAKEKELKVDENGAIVLEVVKIESKYVPKYHNENNQGYITTLTLKNGKTVGAFSNALHEFANFFYEGAGVNLDDTFKKVDIKGADNKPGFVKVKVTKIDLDGSKSTYEFEVIDGNVEGLTRQEAINIPLLTE
jgi:hypothetical protein